MKTNLCLFVVMLGSFGMYGGEFNRTTPNQTQVYQEVPIYFNKTCTLYGCLVPRPASEGCRRLTKPCPPNLNLPGMPTQFPTQGRPVHSFILDPVQNDASTWGTGQVVGFCAIGGLSAIAALFCIRRCWRCRRSPAQAHRPLPDDDGHAVEMDSSAG